MRLTKTYEDGTYGVADDLPCGENSHEFKKLLIDKLGAIETHIEKRGKEIQQRLIRARERRAKQHKE